MNDLITRQMAYKRELDKIMSMNVGETHRLDRFPLLKLLDYRN